MSIRWRIADCLKDECCRGQWLLSQEEVATQIRWHNGHPFAVPLDGGSLQ
jgi:hypothetical protein